MNISVRLPDGSAKEYPAGVTPRQIAEDIGPGLAQNAIAALVDGETTRPAEWLTEASTTVARALGEVGRPVDRVAIASQDRGGSCLAAQTVPKIESTHSDLPQCDSALAARPWRDPASVTRIDVRDAERPMTALSDLL